MHPGRTGFAAVVIAVLSAAAAGARADELLRGPHPFLRDNELSLHVGYAAGLGDSWNGPKTVLDYGYKVHGSWWLNVELGHQSAGCQGGTPGTCGGSGDIAEVLAGAKWKLRTEVPVVPYAKAAVGLLYVFPDGVKSAAGLAVRAGIGGKYFLYDWFGLGVELMTMVGHAGDLGSVQTLEATAGVELQF